MIKHYKKNLLIKPNTLKKIVKKKTSFNLYVNSKSNESRDVKFNIVISINPDPPPPRPVKSRPSSLLNSPHTSEG